MTGVSGRRRKARTLQPGDDIVLPRPFGRHVVVTQQAAGTGRSLYKLRDTRGRLRALKLHPATPTARQRVERAAHLQHQVRGACVLRLLGAWRHPSHTVVLEEWALGPTLAESLDRERHGGAPASLALLLRRAHAMACAVAHVHGANVLHRDIKPDNFQHRTREALPTHLVLADFGLARPMASCATEGAGTLAYQAPEVAAGSAHTAGADVFSLGASIIEMVVGMAPYEAATERHTLQALLNDTRFVVGSDVAFVLARLGLARGMSRRLAGVLCAMTDRSTTARPTAKTVADGFRPWL